MHWLSPFFYMEPKFGPLQKRIKNDLHELGLNFSEEQPVTPFFDDKRNEDILVHTAQAFLQVSEVTEIQRALYIFHSRLYYHETLTWQWPSWSSTRHFPMHQQSPVKHTSRQLACHPHVGWYFLSKMIWALNHQAHIECIRRNLPSFGRTWLWLIYINITKLTCIKSWMVMDITAW